VLFSEDNLPDHVVARAERPGMLKALVRAGIGIAYLTALGVERDLDERKLAWTPLSPGIIKPATISLMVARGRIAPLYTQAFVDILKRELLALQV
jgi:DNA-binding transcriptional LysR family regulator